MSSEDIKRGLHDLTKSGRLDPAAAHAAMARPLEGEQLLRLDRIEREQERQSTALFGDFHLNPPGNSPGLVRQVQDVRYLVHRATWIITGGVAVGSAVITAAVTIVGLYIEWSKH